MKLLVILTTYGTTPIGYAESFYRGVLAKVDAFYNEQSYGQQRFSDITITDWLKVPAKPAVCSYFLLMEDGNAAATAAGYNVSAYDFIVYLFEQGPSCGWSGLGLQGAKRCLVNRIESFNVAVLVHEFGHALGLAHAASYRSSGGLVIDGVEYGISEYGDRFSAMGGRTMHFNAIEKAKLGWIKPEQVAHYSGPATFTVSPIEVPGGQTYAVAIQASPKRTYWVEYRTPVGFDKDLTAGAQIRLAPPYEVVSDTDSLLLDMTPATTSFDDAALFPGQRFTDTKYNLAIDVISADSLLTIKVGPATDAPPVIVPPVVVPPPPPAPPPAPTDAQRLAAIKAFVAAA